jgi:hypothetical protein
MPQIVLNVSTRRVHALLGSFTSFLASIKNIGTGTAQGIKLSITGAPVYWITVTPLKSDIEVGKSEDYLVLIKVPLDASEGAYQLKVKGTDGIESNEEIVFLTVAKDWESLAKNLYLQVNASEENVMKVKLLECIDLSDILDEIASSQKMKEIAVKEFNEKNWKKAIEYFEYVLDKYDKVIDIANFKMDEEFLRLKPFSFPPFSQAVNEKFVELSKNLKERNYRSFCKNLAEVKKYSSYSQISLIIVISVLAACGLIIFLAFRKRVEFEPFRRLRRIRERLKLGKEENI